MHVKKKEFYREKTEKREKFGKNVAIKRIPVLKKKESEKKPLAIP
jgi:hypothetical protein